MIVHYGYDLKFQVIVAWFPNLNHRISRFRMLDELPNTDAQGGHT